MYSCRSPDCTVALAHTASKASLLHAEDSPLPSQRPLSVRVQASDTRASFAGYFLSRPCLREVRAAVSQRKPLILVHEIDEKKGGTLTDLRNDCPPDLQGAVFESGFPIVRWHRLPDLQIVTLLQIASALVSMQQAASADASQVVLSSFPTTPSTSLLYLPSAVTEKRIEMESPVRLFVSSSNDGAEDIASLLLANVQPKKAAGSLIDTRSASRLTRLTRTSRSSEHGHGLHVSADIALTSAVEHSTHMLLYLKTDTFSPNSPHADGDTLAAEVRAARATGVQILIVHEQRDGQGRCAFDRFFYSTPEDLISSGLYNDLAIPFFDSPIEQTVALALVYKKIASSQAQSARRISLLRAGTCQAENLWAGLTRNRVRQMPMRNPNVVGMSPSALSARRSPSLSFDSRRRW